MVTVSYRIKVKAEVSNSHILHATRYSNALLLKFWCAVMVKGIGGHAGVSLC